VCDCWKCQATSRRSQPASGVAPPAGEFRPKEYAIAAELAEALPFETPVGDPDRWAPDARIDVCAVSQGRGAMTPAGLFVIVVAGR
jgi:hypothetical protein